MIKGVTPDAQDKVYFPAKTFTFFSVELSHVGTDDFSPLALSVGMLLEAEISGDLSLAYSRHLTEPKVWSQM